MILVQASLYPKKISNFFLFHIFIARFSVRLEWAERPDSDATLHGLLSLPSFRFGVVSRNSHYILNLCCFGIILISQATFNGLP